MRTVLLTLATALALHASAQAPTGSVRGHVTDARTGQPLPLTALMARTGGDGQVGTTTDSLGAFHLPELPVGLVEVTAHRVGHGTLVVPEVWVRAGKETVITIELEPAAYDLDIVTITALAREGPGALGVREFTVEQGLRYPAMFQDPARLVTGTPGVAAPNDQANHLIVRGNSPNANAWLIEGAEIVNPNHLGNAGTPTDLPTLSGGGVNVLSAQMLGPSRLRTGVSPVMYGNALGGLMDMELRREWTLQAGLTGLDLSTEGPIGRSGRAFHLVNYRYSTIGILSAAGVDLGDEAITFHDLSVHAGTRLGERGELRFFALGGTSRNVFTAVEDTADRAFDKDSQDITYKAGTGAVGATLHVPLGAGSRFRSTVAWSSTYQTREAIEHDTAVAGPPRTYHGLDERKLSAVMQAEGGIGTRMRYAVGASAMLRQVDNLFDDLTEGWLMRPFAQVRYHFTEHLHAHAGLAYSHYTFNGSDAVEPRAGIRWRTGRRGSLSAAYGVRSQLPYHPIMAMPRHQLMIDPPIDNDRRGLMRSQDITVGHEHAFSERLVLRTEVYRQHIDGMPLMRLDSTGSAFNAWDARLPRHLTGGGEAEASGVEIGLVRHFTDGLYYQANGSVLRSRYRDLAGTWRDARWDVQWTANLMAGREFRKEKEDRVRTWGVSGRLFGMGGLRHTPIADDTTPSNGVMEPYGARQEVMYRLDLRVYLKTDRTGRTGQWAIDIQNATNARNEAFTYFDRRRDEAVVKYQMGLVPNLSYRIEF
ncbi:MAG: TonB-dependent receptor [Flavobacteriales bacterium]|jgi:hypothetical protein|nr:TonB-dependent receptor [Flavobacteriales bacterium]